jgi:hypothetical protein
MHEAVYHMKFNWLNTLFDHFHLLHIFILMIGVGSKKTVTTPNCIDLIFVNDMLYDIGEGKVLIVFILIVDS